MFEIVIILVLVNKSFCNTVCIYGHANKASCCFCMQQGTRRRTRSNRTILERGGAVVVGSGGWGAGDDYPLTSFDN